VDQLDSAAAQANETRLIASRSLLVLAGLASFGLSAWGCVASLMLDYRTTDVLLAPCLILPFPVFLSSIRSLRLTAFLLWVLFFGQWFVRQFVVQVITNKPNPVLNPLDQIGVMYFGIAIAVQIAYLLRSGKGERQSKNSETES
jgi:hypothetical protein